MIAPDMLDASESASTLLTHIKKLDDRRPRIAVFSLHDARSPA
jgi:hypothetical protein